MTENYDGKHEVGDPIRVDGGIDPAHLTAEVEATIVQTVPNTVLNQAKYYGKAIGGALISGLLYLLTVLTPAATVGDITLVQWIGFWVSVLGTGLGVGVITNGAKPTRP